MVSKLGEGLRRLWRRGPICIWCGAPLDPHHENYPHTTAAVWGFCDGCIAQRLFELRKNGSPEPPGGAFSMSEYDPSRHAGAARGSSGQGWRERLLRILASGVVDRHGNLPDLKRLLRTFDRIDADPDLGERLDTLSDRELREEFMALYEED